MKIYAVINAYYLSQLFKSKLTIFHSRLKTTTDKTQGEVDLEGKWLIKSSNIQFWQESFNDFNLTFIDLTKASEALVGKIEDIKEGKSRRHQDIKEMAFSNLTILIDFMIYCLLNDKLQARFEPILDILCSLLDRNIFKIFAYQRLMIILPTGETQEQFVKLQSAIVKSMEATDKPEPKMTIHEKLLDLTAKEINQAYKGVARDYQMFVTLDILFSSHQLTISKSLPLQLRLIYKGYTDSNSIYKRLREKLKINVWILQWVTFPRKEGHKPLIFIAERDFIEERKFMRAAGRKFGWSLSSDDSSSSGDEASDSDSTTSLHTAPKSLVDSNAPIKSIARTTKIITFY